MKKYLFLLLLTICSLRVQAQLFPTLGEQRAGISTAQFLKIGVGGRATALGDAFVAIANDASSLYWNPAGIVLFGDNQVLFAHNSWLVDINHEFAGAVYHLDEDNALGLSVTSLSTQKMKVTTEFAPFGTGEYFSFGDFAFGVTYARRMTNKFSFGATVRYLDETLGKLNMRGVVVDLGTFYYTGLGSSRFAVAVSNFGNQLAPDGEVVLVGKRSKTQWQSFSPPTMFRFGFAMEPYETPTQKLTTSIQLNHPNDNSENVSLGAEYYLHLPEYATSLALRGGYKLNVDEQGFTFGAGIEAPVPYARLTVDYAYAAFSRLGATHRFSLNVGF